MLDPSALKAKIAELEDQASAPDLWDDQDNAQAVTSALSAANSELERITGFGSRLDDLEVLIEMAVEADDAEVLAEAERDLTTLRKDLAAMEVRTLMAGEWDERNAVVTIRSGAGGDDATDFAEMLLRMYLRWAERHGYAAKVLDTSYAEGAGIKSATFEVNAPYAFGTLSVEAGTHRLARISPFGSADKRQTQFAAVEVIPLIEGTDHIEVPETDIKVDVFRSSGPGGQSVNTTDSAVRLTHLPTGHRGVDAGREEPDPEPRGRDACAPVPAAVAEEGRRGRPEEGTRGRHQGSVGATRCGRTSCTANNW